MATVGRPLSQRRQAGATTVPSSARHGGPVARNHASVPGGSGLHHGDGGEGEVELPGHSTTVAPMHGASGGKPGSSRARTSVGGGGVNMVAGAGGNGVGSGGGGDMSVHDLHRHMAKLERQLVEARAANSLAAVAAGSPRSACHVVPTGSEELLALELEMERKYSTELEGRVAELEKAAREGGRGGEGEAGSNSRWQALVDRLRGELEAARKEGLDAVEAANVLRQQRDDTAAANAELQVALDAAQHALAAAGARPTAVDHDAARELVAERAKVAELKALSKEVLNKLTGENEDLRRQVAELKAELEVATATAMAAKDTMSELALRHTAVAAEWEQRLAAATAAHHRDIQLKDAELASLQAMVHQLRNGQAASVGPSPRGISQPSSPPSPTNRVPAMGAGVASDARRSVQPAPAVTAIASSPPAIDSGMPALQAALHARGLAPSILAPTASASEVASAPTAPAMGGGGRHRRPPPPPQAGGSGRPPPTAHVTPTFNLTGLAPPPTAIPTASAGSTAASLAPSASFTNPARNLSFSGVGGAYQSSALLASFLHPVDDGTRPALTGSSHRNWGDSGDIGTVGDMPSTAMLPMTASTQGMPVTLPVPLVHGEEVGGPLGGLPATSHTIETAPAAHTTRDLPAHRGSHHSSSDGSAPGLLPSTAARDEVGGGGGGGGYSGRTSTRASPPVAHLHASPGGKDAGRDAPGLVVAPSRGWQGTLGANMVAESEDAVLTMDDEGENAPGDRGGRPSASSATGRPRSTSGTPPSARGRRPRPGARTGTTPPITSTTGLTLATHRAMARRAANGGVGASSITSDGSPTGSRSSPTQAPGMAAPRGSSATGTSKVPAPPTPPPAATVSSTTVANGDMAGAAPGRRSTMDISAEMASLRARLAQDNAQMAARLELLRGAAARLGSHPSTTEAGAMAADADTVSNVPVTLAEVGALEANEPAALTA